jgi:hypothetical protein
MASLDSYYSERFRESREVFDWINQFTNQFTKMGLIGPKDTPSFKKELLSIIKKESKPGQWNTHENEHDKDLGPVKQGYGIMACRHTCNDAVQEYWEKESQEKANSWGFGSYNKNKPETEKYPVNVTDYADTVNGVVTNPKEAMYRGAMYYAILRRQARTAMPDADAKDVIKQAFKSYNGSGDTAEDYSVEAMSYLDGSLQAANDAGEVEYWDKSNYSQGAAGIPKAVASDIASTYRMNVKPVVDPWLSNDNLGRKSYRSAIGQGVTDVIQGKDQIDPATGKPTVNAISDPGDFLSTAITGPARAAIRKGWPKVKGWQNDAERYAGNLAKLAGFGESLEESTEQEILVKFAKEILGLDISDEQMQQVIQQLDITDIVGIKRAIESGDFEGLRLGESRLKEYHSSPEMANRAKEQRASKEPTERAAGQQSGPRERTRIAGNNANPERPPTGTSSSTAGTMGTLPPRKNSDAITSTGVKVVDATTGEPIGGTVSKAKARRIAQYANKHDNI